MKVMDLRCILHVDLILLCLFLVFEVAVCCILGRDDELEAFFSVKTGDIAFSSWSVVSVDVLGDIVSCIMSEKLEGSR